MASRHIKAGESERFCKVNFGVELSKFDVSSQGIQGHGKWKDNPSMDET